jgi:hypothetical protein
VAKPESASTPKRSDRCLSIKGTKRAGPDLIGTLGPDERLRIGVMGFDELLYSGFEFVLRRFRHTPPQQADFS